MPDISTKELAALCEQALITAGVAPKHAAMIADHYLDNEFSGKSSHGVVRVIEAAKSAHKFPKPSQEPKITQESNGLALFDALGHIGAFAVQFALEHAIVKAKNEPILFAGIRNYIASSGSLSYYLKQVADCGLIGIMGCNSVALVAPPAGKKRMIGTNPIGFAIPGAAPDQRLISDIATSAIAYGKIMVMNEKGESVPEGVLIDQNGNPSTNPKDAYDGAILPLEGYKGFGLGLAIELLAGPLIGAKAIKDNLYDQDGFFMILINPEKFGNPNFYEQTSEALEALKSSPTRPNFEEITLPGERSSEKRKETKRRSSVTVAQASLDKLYALCDTPASMEERLA
jgi:LDH2 family malate/lactate/ureidoglycolate dehydrogenase